MNNPTAMMAAIATGLIAIAFAVKRESAPWYLTTVAFGLLSLLYLNAALGTPSLDELTHQSKECAS